MPKKSNKVVTLLDITAFASLAGVSRTAIYKAIKEGRVVRRKNKKIDIGNDLNKHFLSTHGKSKKKGKTGAKLTKPKLGNKSDTYRPEEIDLSTEVGKTRMEAELKKVQAAALHNEIKVKQDRSMLIDRRVVLQLIGIMAAIDTNELLTIPGNIAPEIAGVCGKEDNKTILKVSKKLETHLYGVLKHRKREINSWLKKIGAEVSKDE